MALAPSEKYLIFCHSWSQVVIRFSTNCDSPLCCELQPRDHLIPRGRGIFQHKGAISGRLVRDKERERKSDRGQFKSVHGVVVDPQ